MKFALILIFIASSLFAAGEVSFQITETQVFDDGGTVFARLESKDGQEVIVCIDRQLSSKHHLEMFVGAEHPTMKEAKLAPESTRKKLTQVLVTLLALEPKKYYDFRKVFKEHLEKHKKSEQTRSSNSLQPSTSTSG